MVEAQTIPQPSLGRTEVAVKTGAPPGNRNAMRNGRYAFFSTGRMPKGAGYVARLVNQFRKELQCVIRERDGDVDLYQSAVIQTACRHEARAVLAQRWMREKFDKLTVEQLLSLTREIGTASDSRDKALKALHLDRQDTADVFAAIYAIDGNGNAQLPHAHSRELTVQDEPRVVDGDKTPQTAK